MTYGLLLALGFHALVRLYEEPTLRRSFGVEYDEYCRRVRRWIPAIPERIPRI